MKAAGFLIAAFLLGGVGGFGLAHVIDLEAAAASSLSSMPYPVATEHRVISSAASASEGLQQISVDETPKRGLEDAPIEIVVFADFGCVHCGRASDMLDRVLRDYDDQVVISFRHLPLPEHALSRSAHRAAIASGKQGRFWEMHDRLFAQRGKLDRSAYREYASQIGLDVPRFLSDLSDSGLDEAIERDLAEAKRLGVEETPSFFINGNSVVGAQPYANFRTLIERERTKLANPAEFARERALRLATSRMRAMRDAEASTRR